MSPDRRTIVSEFPGQPVNLYTESARGASLRRVTHNGSANNFAPTFSPDSRRILYFQNGGTADGIHVMNADGSGDRRLTSDAGFGPVFSPNGAQIAYFTTGIAIAGADGSGSHVILSNTRTVTGPLASAVLTTVRNSEPNWSPDGRRIVFTRESLSANAGGSIGDEFDVYSMNADGSDVRQLTSTPSVNEDEPSWSPDGRQIAYFRQPFRSADGVGEIWVMNADGSGKRVIALGWHPHWSSVQGSPGRPRLLVHFQKINKHSSCLGQLDGVVASVSTRASKRTLFDIAMSFDGRVVEQQSGSRSLGFGVDGLRRGTHRVKVVMSDSAVHDGAVRTLRFRKC